MPDGHAPKKRRMPKQKPGTSEQVVGTPKDFLVALEYRFGPLSWDLCATAENSVVPGRFFDVATDGLKQDWGAIEGNLWCNPGFGEIAKWAEKAAEEATVRSKVFLLTPASIGANWYWKFLRPNAVTYVLHPRLQFVGHEHPFPKDLAVHVLGLGATALGRWRWKDELEKSREEALRPPIGKGMIEASDSEELDRKLRERAKGKGGK